MSEQQQKELGVHGHAWNTIKGLSAGAVAGAVSRTATSPLERLKVMKQMQAKSTKYGGVFSSLMKMYKEEGLKSYWKGNGTNVARIAPFSAIQFFSFDVYKRALVPDGQSSTLLVLTAGGLAGATASTICYPLDLARSILTVQTHSKEYTGIGHTLRTIHARDGIAGLYRGLSATLMGIAPYVAINFAVFDKLKTKFLPSRDDPHYNKINFCLGAVSGGTAAALTYPTDLIRRRIQLGELQMKDLDIPKVHTTKDCIMGIYKEEGLRGFYKGLTPCLLKVVPSMAIAFMIYENLRKTLRFDPPKSKAPGVG